MVLSTVRCCEPYGLGSRAPDLWGGSLCHAGTYTHVGGVRGCGLRSGQGRTGREGGAIGCSARSEDPGCQASHCLQVQVVGSFPWEVDTLVLPTVVGGPGVLVAAGVAVWRRRCLLCSSCGHASPPTSGTGLSSCVWACWRVCAVCRGSCVPGAQGPSGGASVPYSRALFEYVGLVTGTSNLPMTETQRDSRGSRLRGWQKVQGRAEHFPVP